MTDELDRAEEAIEVGLAAALTFRYQPGPRPTGFCLYCGEILESQLRWCVGTECEREWEREKARRHANGLPGA